MKRFLFFLHKILQSRVQMTTNQRQRNCDTSLYDVMEKKGNAGPDSHGTFMFTNYYNLNYCIFSIDKNME